MCVCELHRKGESQTGWCHLHCATAVFKDTGKLTPFSLPSPCPKHDTVQSCWRPPPWPRGEVVFTGSHRDLLFSLRTLSHWGFWWRPDFGLFGWFESSSLTSPANRTQVHLKMVIWETVGVDSSTVFNEYEQSSPRFANLLSINSKT